MEKSKKTSSYWSLSVQDTTELLVTDITDGLSEEEAAARLQKYGRNAIEHGRHLSKLRIVLNQFKSPLIIVLLIAGVVTLLIGHYKDSIFIFIAAVVNTILGFYQENKAENALAKLKTYLKQEARVMRNGEEKQIDAKDVVVGDIMLLSQGDRVQGDGRIVFVNDFQVDEAVLTGESLPVTKSAEPVAFSASISDQDSMVFAGTLVTQGYATVIVTDTGLQTELGKISSLLAISSSEQTPLQKAVYKFSIYSSIILGLLTLVVFVVGILVGYSPLDMFLTSVAIAVSAIPEGLPVSMTVILAVGVERMARRKGVVRKLVAAEALGGTTVILTDKTGTLTMAKMVMSQLISVAVPAKKLLSYALSNANAIVENPEDAPEKWRIDGRIMEAALVRAAASEGMSYKQILSKRKVLQSWPFNSSQKYSATLIKDGGRILLIVLGAPDVLIHYSQATAKQKKQLTEQISSLAFSGERVLGLASKEISDKEQLELLKKLTLNNLSFDGLITFKDPIRPGIKSAIARVARAGVKTVILTGDHQGTAVAVAEEIGLEMKEGSVLDASELTGLKKQQLQKRLPYLKVISRVTPFDKLQIAKLLQESGEVVAMTGDGINDAPSIKQANVGIAMGSGTEVAQSVADLVLLDDNFETIVAAIEEGRQIIGNIRKVLVYLLSNVTDGLILIGSSLLLGLPLPLNALQILWVNFFADSFPAVAFAFEKDGDHLSVPPRNPNAGLFDPLMKFLIIVIGFSTSALLSVLYFVLTRAGLEAELVRTFIFAAFGTYTLILAFSVRSLEQSIFSYPLLSNKYLNSGVLIGFVLMAAAIYLPPLQNLFGTKSLSAVWIGGVLMVGILNILLIELAKYFFRRRR
ncbi:HAD-IC family P-type ATPase [bacterium]|nr:MAG: HAD-IC family P-type ATPase [bacterium]